jgi:hypothetical protein
MRPESTAGYSVGSGTCLGPGKKPGNAVRDEKTIIIIKGRYTTGGRRCIITIMVPGGVAG